MKIKTKVNIQLYWLSSLCFLIFSIIIVGGLTRLTGSGLSMVDWNPIMGTVPPITQNAWELVFEKYKQFPEYKLENFAMTLSEFKTIFLWEYIHRMLGRLIGLAIIIPWIVLTVKKVLSKKEIINGAVITFLVVTQGIIGWYMVKSGLVNIPEVSHFRLSLHLSLALILLQFIIWQICNLYVEKKRCNALAFTTFWWSALVCLQIIYGAFTAGLKAGHLYGTYPKMGDEWIPEAITMMGSFVDNIFFNPIMIQFIHRHLPLIIICWFCYILFSFLKNNKHKLRRRLSILIFLGLILQSLFGILTLVLKMPIYLASIHQDFGVILLTCIIIFNHSLRHSYDKAL